MDPYTEVFQKKAKIITESFKAKNIQCFHYLKSEDAIQKVLFFLDQGDTIGFGGSTTIIDCGLIDILRDGHYELIDRYKHGLTKEEMFEKRLESLRCDVFITSTNALTMDGRLVNIDGIGNRVASMAFGPKKVIVLAGKNKIVEDMDAGIARVREIAAPMNAVRLGLNPPCANTGICDEMACFPPDRLCNVISVIESQAIENRMYVILINENLGF